jgi:hypothetical protein
MRRWLSGILLVPLALAGCGSDHSARHADGSHASAGPHVSIAVDRSIQGDQRLLAGPRNDLQRQRVAITPKGIPTALFAVRVRHLDEDVQLRAVSTVTVTKCLHTDYHPEERAHTGCQYTKHYDYSPVRVKTAFRAYPDAHGEPDLSSPGMPVGRPKRSKCNDVKHHCTMLNLGRTRLDRAALRRRPEWVVMEMTARSPKAARCRSHRAHDCQVLAVEVQKGQVMYLAGVDRDVPQSVRLARGTRELVHELNVVDNIGDGTGRKSERRVLYSIRLSRGERIESLAGDQLEVGARVRVSSTLRRVAPLVTTYFVLSKSRDGTTGRYLESDSYSPARSGNAGQNCVGACAFARNTMATAILPCDIKAGRRYLNLVAGAARDSASAGDRTVAVGQGEMRLIRYYESKYSEPTPGRC